MAMRHVARIVAIVIALSLLFVETALADGGVPLVSGAVAGQYDISIFSNAVPLQKGVADISVLLLKRGTTEIVNDAVVTIEATPAGGENAITALATRELATNKLFYAANVDLPSTGSWQFHLRIQGPLGEAETTFTRDVESNWLASSSMVWYAVGIALAGLVVLVLQRRGRKRPASKRAARR